MSRMQEVCSYLLSKDGWTQLKQNTLLEDLKDHIGDRLSWNFMVTNIGINQYPKNPKIVFPNVVFSGTAWCN